MHTSYHGDHSAPSPALRLHGRATDPVRQQMKTIAGRVVFGECQDGLIGRQAVNSVIIL